MTFCDAQSSCIDFPMRQRLTAAIASARLSCRAGGGTPHKPAVLRPNGHVLHEAEACVDHLVGAGLPASKLFKEVRRELEV